MLPWDAVSLLGSIKESQSELQVPSSQIAIYKVETEKVQYMHRLLTENAILFEVWKQSSMKSTPCDIITTDWGGNIQSK